MTQTPQLDEDLHRTEPVSGSAGDGGGAARAPQRPGAGVGWLRLLLLVGAIVVLGLLAGASVVALVLAVVVSIFLHELGHFLVAKRAGMKVTEFFIGFGPRIWSFTRGETEYGVKAIPAGAYVKIIGMNNLDEVPRADEAQAFRQKSYPKRVAAAAAGPVMNFVFAFLLLVGLGLFWGLPEGGQWPEVDVADGSAAAAAGFRDGDRLLTFDGEPVPGEFGQFAGMVADSPGATVPVEIERGGEVLTLDVTLGERILGISGSEWPELHVQPDSFASQADLAPRGDELVAVDGGEVPATFSDFVDELMAAEGGSIELVIDRDGQEYTTSLPVPPGARSTGFLGVSRHNPEPEPVDAVSVVPEAGQRFGEMAWGSVYGLYQFFSPSGLTGFADQVVSTPTSDSSSSPPPVQAGDEPAADTELPELPPPEPSTAEQTDRVVSIVGVVQIGSQLNAAGMVLLLALLNVFLGIFNLLPLLPFDGGHIAVATYERAREGLNRVGLYPAKLVGSRYMADFSKLIPVTYAVVVLIVAIGLGALWLDTIDPPSVTN